MMPTKGKLNMTCKNADIVRIANQITILGELATKWRRLASKVPQGSVEQEAYQQAAAQRDDDICAACDKMRRLIKAGRA